MTRGEVIEEIRSARGAVAGIDGELALVAAELHYGEDVLAVDRLGIIMEQLESARCWIRRAHASADRQFKEGASWTISGRRRERS